MKKYLFLDIDGVLNSINYQLREIALGNYLNLNIDPNAVDKLKHIIQKTNCEIVLSSVWRGSGPDSYIPSLKNAGFPIDEIPIIYHTPNCFERDGDHLIRSPRGMEIDMWMKSSINISESVLINCDNESQLKDLCMDNNFYNYCILDDDIHDMLKSQEHNITSTNLIEGLTDSIANSVIELLNTPYWKLSHSFYKD